MSERIRELVRQAVVAVDIVTGNEALDDELAKMYIPDCFSEKLAELIVRECIQASEAHAKDLESQPTDPLLEAYEDGVVNGIYEATAAIKKHFGVEE
jgi:hypothetical protein